MDFLKSGVTNNYDRVMPRVKTQSVSTLKSSSRVTRHEIPSSVRVGAKSSISNVSSGIFSELPTVLNDYDPPLNDEKPVKKSKVTKPRKTIKSLDPALSPPRTVEKLKEAKASDRSRYIRTRGSAPSVVFRDEDKWSASHVRQCHSSRSHTRLKELKDEIKAFDETDKKLRMRSKLFKQCGIMLDDLGQVAANKSVQADVHNDETEPENRRRLQWLQMIRRDDLKNKPNFTSYRVCEKHFTLEDVLQSSNRKLLKKNALPLLMLPSLASTDPGVSRKEDKQTQTAPLVGNDNGTQTENATNDISTQTSTSLSSNTPRKRKLKAQLLQCRKKIKLLTRN